MAAQRQKEYAVLKEEKKADNAFLRVMKSRWPKSKTFHAAKLRAQKWASALIDGSLDHVLKKSKTPKLMDLFAEVVKPSKLTKKDQELIESAS
jgi:hypothetical protein